MSAGPKAIPLSEENPNWEKDHPGQVECYGCRWEGQFYELLCEPDEETLWCPQCKASGWAYK